MRRTIKLFHIILLLPLLFNSCKNRVSAKEFSDFVKDERNGYTKNFESAGLHWNVTYAVKEFMAVNELKMNKPKAKEFETAQKNYADMAYFIVRVEGASYIPFDCSKFFVASCESGAKSQPLICEQIITGISSQKEFLTAYPISLANCPESICLYATVSDKGYTPVGCFQVSEMEELPQIKLY